MVMVKKLLYLLRLLEMNLMGEGRSAEKILPTFNQFDFAILV